MGEIMNTNKKILFIGTGGTIASDITPQGMSPNFDAYELAALVPELEKICKVDCLALYNIDSTNISQKHWCGIAETIKEYYGAYDGFVITHGTDTMAYTAAALSYLVQDATKPIVITGSQRPPGFDGSDAKTNLRDSFICAACGCLTGVFVVFDGRIIAGTRAKKTRSKGLNAFESINFPYLASITGGRLIRYIEPKTHGRVHFYDSLKEDIGLLRMYPTIKPCQLEHLLSRCDGVVIESYGSGGLPGCGNGEFEKILNRAFERGVFVAITTQVEHDGSDLEAYAVGRRLTEYPMLLECYDMTAESAVTKLAWVLSRSRDTATVRKLFYTPVMFDIFPPDDVYDCLI